MKKITALFLIFCSLSAIGQTKLKIEINNPEPRVGQSFTFSIKLDFLTDYFNKELAKNINFTHSAKIPERQSNDIEREIIFKKAGKYKIGPFDFEFNGIKYTTETIEVNILPELPLESGLWVRVTELNGKQYLILEQMINNESNKTEENEFADINENLRKKIKLYYSSSETNTILPENAGFSDGGFSYSIKRYEIKYDKNLDEEYIILETDFNNLPQKFHLGKIKIKK